MAAPKPPAGLADRGRRLWRAYAETLDEARRQILVDACRLADRSEQLAELVAVQGPAGVAARHARETAAMLARLVTALRLPDDAGKVPQRRGLRGVQAPSGGATVTPLSAGERLRRARQGS